MNPPVNGLFTARIDDNYSVIVKECDVKRSNSSDCKVKVAGIGPFGPGIADFHLEYEVEDENEIVVLVRNARYDRWYSQELTERCVKQLIDDYHNPKP